MLKINRHFKTVLLLLGLSYIFFFLGNSVLSLTNPDEVFYVQTAKEMMVRHSGLTPYLFGAPQFEKPIFTYWLLRFAFCLFGISSFGARFFPAFFAAIGVVAVYFLGLLGFKDEKKAFISALVLLSSGLYIGLARTVFTDLIFSVLILLSLLSFFWSYSRPERKGTGILLFFACSGLAVLTKGPLGLLIPFLIVFFFLGFRGDLRFFLCRDFLLGVFAFCLISLPWYILIIRKFGNQFINEFFYNDHVRRIIEAEHHSSDTWYFYSMSMIGGVFPWSVYLIFSLIVLFRRLRKNVSPIHLFLACWILSVLTIFQPPHSKLASYIFPVFAALALAMGDFIGEALSRGKGRSLFFISLGTWILILPLPIGLAVAGHRYSAYLKSSGPIYLLIAVLVLYLAFMLYLILKRKFSVQMYLLAFLMPLLLFFAFSRVKDFDYYVASKDSGAYLLKNTEAQNTVLCSKMLVRGIRYYTDKDVAVFDTKRKGFFSPHPIPLLDTDEGVRNFLHKQSVTYAVLTKSDNKDLQRIAGEEFTLEVLQIIGDEYIVRVTSKA